MATRAKFARLAQYSRKFSKASHIFLKKAFGECLRVWRVLAKVVCKSGRVWRVLAKLLANVDEFGESSQKWLANVGESGESHIFPKKVILANASNRQIH
jgi:hypothetical protein